MSLADTAAAPARLAGLTLPAWRRLWLVGTLAVAVLLPLFLKNFTVFQLTLVMVYAIAILGLNLLTGFNGQFSLGHSAFYAIGAYTAAIMMDRFDLPYWLTLPVAGVLCLVAGFLFGLPALRLEGLYLALATFALAIAMPQILKLSLLEHWTGGVQGIVIIKPDAPFGLPISQDQWLYYFTLIVMLFLFWAASNLVSSRTGRALMAIRDNPLAAKSMGIDTALYKSLTFGVSGLYTGIAGALGAIVIQFVAPDSFNFFLAVSFLVGLVVGGVGWVPGAIIGGAFTLFVPNIADELAKNLGSNFKGLAWAIYGLILILIIYVMPAGAGGFIRLVTQRLMRRT